MFSIFSVHGQLIFWNRSSEFTENWQGVKLFGINDKAQQPFHKLKFTEPTFQKKLFSSPILSPPKPSRKMLPLPPLLVLATTCLSSCYSLLCYQLQTCLPSHLDGKLLVCSTHILFIILFACNPLVSAVSMFRDECSHSETMWLTDGLPFKTSQPALLSWLGVQCPWVG